MDFNGNEFLPEAILVTGAAGFIGSHLVEALIEEFPKAMIYSLDSLEYCGSLRNLDPVMDSERHKFIKGDIKSFDLVAFILRTKNIDTIVHLAAQSHVDNSFGNSLDFTLTNVFGTHVLLEAAKQYRNLKLFLHISTDEVYGENTDECEHDETLSMLQPTNPYASSKAAAELICQSYLRSFNLPLIITRGNNVYGPKQYPEKLIPKFSVQWQRGLQLTIHGNGDTSRNYIHVKDVVNALVTVIKRGAVGQVYNIGGNEEFSVLEITKRIIRYYLSRELNIPEKKITSEQLSMGLEDRCVFTRDRHYNDKRYNIANKKLVQLGWKQTIYFQEGLSETLNWYDDHSNWANWGERALGLSILAHPRLEKEPRDQNVFEQQG